MLRAKVGLGPTLWNKQFWFVGHIIPAVVALFLGPLQFWTWFRANKPKWHRAVGKTYIICALIAGVCACYLAFSLEAGSIIPVLLQSILWVYMSFAAWMTIRKKNIKAHRIFTIRSYVLAMTFVFVRLLAHPSMNFLFAWMKSQSDKNITLQWLSWTVPLLLVELTFSWIPVTQRYNSDIENR
jgi:uncharacterized membrane protein